LQNINDYKGFFNERAMGIRNYTVGKNFTGNIAGVYMPGAEEFADGLEFIGRDDDRPNPRITWRVRDIQNSRVQVTLHEEECSVHHIDLAGDDSEMPRIMAAAEKGLGVQLALLEPHP